jgi:hypothetical protein
MRRFCSTLCPGKADDGAPFSIELSSQPKLHAWSDDGGPVIEVALAHSSATGPATRIRTNRQFLRRALQLAFTDLHFSNADQPVCRREGHRYYFWVPLAPNPAAPADRDSCGLRRPSQWRHQLHPSQRPKGGLLP